MSGQYLVFSSENLDEFVDLRAPSQGRLRDSLRLLSATFTDMQEHVYIQSNTQKIFLKGCSWSEAKRLGQRRDRNLIFVDVLFTGVLTICM
jgi:hypothetical protein